MKEKIWYIYMIRCKDNSIYTGITTDITRRFREHIERGQKCAKYTLTHEAKKVEKVWETEGRKNASKLEFYIKQLTKKQKEELIKGAELKEFLDNKLNYKDFTIKKFEYRKT